MTAIVRPKGFSPRETSALVNLETVSRHAEEAAFLWSMRSRAVDEPHYALKDIAALDERVEAHLDGLRIAGNAGWKLCVANSEMLGRGEVFAMSILAFASGDAAKMREALQAACSSDKWRAGIVSALSWLDAGSSWRWIEVLMRAQSADHRLIGLAACVLRRDDPGPALDAALSDAFVPLRRRALRAIGELKREELRGRVYAHLDHQDEGCRFWAASSLSLLGDRAGVDALTAFFEAGGPFAKPAVQLVLRAVGLDTGRALVRRMAAKGDSDALTVFAVGVLGDPVAIPWLVDKMRVDALARRAGEAFSLITGVDLAYNDLDQPNEAEEEDQEGDKEVVGDDRLPRPAPDLVAAYWEQKRDGFSGGKRYLCGKPVSASAALHVLRRGKQRQRAAAAYEWALIDRVTPLFNTRMRGQWQESRLAQWSS